MAASGADLTALTKSFFSGAAGAEEDGHAEEDDSGIPDASAQRNPLPIAAGAAVERFPLAANCKLFASPDKQLYTTNPTAQPPYMSFEGTSCHLDNVFHAGRATLSAKDILSATIFTALYTTTVPPVDALALSVTVPKKAMADIFSAARLAAPAGGLQERTTVGSSCVSSLRPSFSRSAPRPSGVLTPRGSFSAWRRAPFQQKKAPLNAGESAAEASTQPNTRPRGHRRSKKWYHHVQKMLLGPDAQVTLVSRREGEKSRVGPARVSNTCATTSPVPMRQPLCIALVVKGRSSVCRRCQATNARTACMTRARAA